MGRKKAVRVTEGVEKTRVELRFDPDVFDGIKRLADEAQISVNQLMQGLARWAAVRLRVNEEPVRDEDGFVAVKDQPGCLWAGKPGTFVPMTEAEVVDHYGTANVPEHLRFDRDLKNKGDVWLSLDFTERRVVRDDGAGG